MNKWVETKKILVVAGSPIFLSNDNVKWYMRTQHLSQLKELTLIGVTVKRHIETQMYIEF
jgi:hypothetical protein